MKRKRLLSFEMGGNMYFVEFDGKRDPLPPEASAASRRLFVEVSQEEFDAAGEDDKRVDPQPHPRRRADPRPLLVTVSPGPGTKKWTLLLEPHPDRGYTPLVAASLSQVAQTLGARVVDIIEGAQMFLLTGGALMVIAPGDANPFIGIDRKVDVSTFAEWS